MDPRRRGRFRRPRISLLTLLLLHGAATAASAQVGAIAIGAAGGAGDGAARTATPILGEGAFTPPAGRWGGRVLAGITAGSLPGVTGVDLEYTVVEMVASAYYAPVDRLVLGVATRPYNYVAVMVPGARSDRSGFGDASLTAQYQAWRAADRRTAVGVMGGVTLPIGDDVFGAEGPAIAAGVAASRLLGIGSVHVAGGVVAPAREVDGDPTATVSGAVLVDLGERAAVVAEALGRFSADDHLIDVAPGLRFRAGRAHLDLALLLNVSAGYRTAYDRALVLGVGVGTP